MYKTNIKKVDYSFFYDVKLFLSQQQHTFQNLKIGYQQRVLLETHVKQINIINYLFTLSYSNGSPDKCVGALIFFKTSCSI